MLVGLQKRVSIGRRTILFWAIQQIFPVVNRPADVTGWIVWVRAVGARSTEVRLFIGSLNGHLCTTSVHGIPGAVIIQVARNSTRVRDSLASAIPLASVNGGSRCVIVHGSTRTIGDVAVIWP